MKKTIKTVMTVEEVEDRLEEEIRNGMESDIHYWRGYRDALVAVQNQNAG